MTILFGGFPSKDPNVGKVSIWGIELLGDVIVPQGFADRRSELLVLGLSKRVDFLAQM
jgi:hypothetical protein